MSHIYIATSKILHNEPLNDTRQDNVGVLKVPRLSNKVISPRECAHA